MKKPFLLLVLVCVYAITNAQTWDDTVRAIEKAFERYKPANPGAQLAISRHGQVIYSKAWGMADMEHNVSLTTNSPIEAGSVSKQFTAAAILLLEQQGKLTLNDDVRKYLPELPDYGHVITLRHMMQHTSGLKDWGSIASLSGWPRSTKTYSNDDALYYCSLQQTLNNKPGDEYIYSNSGYNLFAVIVERVSGMSLADYTKKYIFEPAGMKHTEWRDDHKKIVPNRAIAYGKTDTYYTNMPNEYVYGNGGLLTTAEDLLTWTHYFTSGKLGGADLYKRQITTSPLNNGIMGHYAAGLGISKYNDAQLISHDGATASYRANLDHFPSLGLSIAFLSNTSEFDRSPNIMGEVRRIFIQPLTAAVIGPPIGTESHTITLQKLKSYEGWYRNDRSGAGLRLQMNNDKLYAAQNIMRPESDNRFTAGTNRIEFPADRKKMLLITSGKDSIYFTPVDSIALTPAKMNEYVGEYFSDEVQTTYFVRVKDGKLVLHQKPKAEYTLRSTYTDAFELPLGSMYFERDKKNKVTGYKITVPRARNVAFRKVK